MAAAVAAATTSAIKGQLLFHLLVQRRRGRRRGELIFRRGNIQQESRWHGRLRRLEDSNESILLRFPGDLKAIPEPMQNTPLKGRLRSKVAARILYLLLSATDGKGAVVPHPLSLAIADPTVHGTPDIPIAAVRFLAKVNE
jgi:hypothetical protein